MAKNTLMAPVLSRSVRFSLLFLCGEGDSVIGAGYSDKLPHVQWVYSARVQTREVAEAVDGAPGAQSLALEARHRQGRAVLVLAQQLRRVLRHPRAQGSQAIRFLREVHR